MPKVKSAADAEQIAITYAKRKYGPAALVKPLNTTRSRNYKLWRVEIEVVRNPLLLSSKERHIILVDLDGNVKGDKPAD